MTIYHSTVTQIAITPDMDPPCSPIYGEQAVFLTIEDEAGGPFFSIRTSEGEVKLDPDELEFIAGEARSLMQQRTLHAPET